jgi:hypothetical protein
VKTRVSDEVEAAAAKETEASLALDKGVEVDPERD